MRTSGSVRKAFKSGHTYSLFTEYVDRISKFVPCQVSGMLRTGEVSKAGMTTWVCDRSAGSSVLSSEAVARHLEKLCNSGIRELHVWVGGPDGFSESELEALKPDLKWSFGSFTLPHELAAVVASEQIYRAFTILHHLPYHSGH